jgi:phenylacetate-CoA ligase
MLKTLVKLTPIFILDKIRKRLLSSYYFSSMIIRYADPEVLDIMSEKLAISMYHKCRKRVPAYNQFISKTGFNHFPRNIDEFNSIPATTKENYIAMSSSFASLCWDGNIKNVNLWVTSSGHSGKETQWGKSNKEIDLFSIAFAAGYDAHYNISKKQTLFINGFIMGTWVTGISFALIVHQKNAMINTGPNEEKIFEALDTFAEEYEQIVILGYPPFIKNLVDYGNHNKFDWTKSFIHFYVGGEYFPEEWRDYIIMKTDDAYVTVLGGYASSDLGIVGGTETTESVIIRKRSKENKELYLDLFGDTRTVPMLFQYPPFLYIHPDTNKELHFTTLFDEYTMPLINYNLEDIGGVISYKKMKKLLKKHKLDMDLKIKWPFLYVEGRSTGAIKLCAFMIYPENIKECIYRNIELSHTTSGKFKIRKEYDKNETERIYIDFELLKGIKNTKKLKDIYSGSIKKTLREINSGYDDICINIPKSSSINIILFEYGKFPHENKIKFNYS